MNWAVVKTTSARFPYEFVARMFITNVPGDVGADEIRSALTRAGHRFGEFGVAWANHSLIPEPDWSNEVVSAYRAGETEKVEWNKLVPASQTVKLTVRVPNELYQRIVAAARERGQTINAFAASVLAAAAEKGRVGGECG